MFSYTIAMRDREVASHLAHTQEIAGSSPAPATRKCLKITGVALKDSGINVAKQLVKGGTTKMPRVKIFSWEKLSIKPMFTWKKITQTNLEI